MSETKDYIRVLYNKCYGGFSLSIEALLEYNKLSDKPLKSCYDLSEGIDCRTDPIVLKVFDLLGSQKFSGKHANIQVEKIDAKYTNHIYISEYDGLECVQVNTRQYNIRDILTSKTLTDTEKVQELKKLLILNNI